MTLKPCNHLSPFANTDVVNLCIQHTVRQEFLANLLIKGCDVMRVWYEMNTKGFACWLLYSDAVSSQQERMVLCPIPEIAGLHP